MQTYTLPVDGSVTFIGTAGSWLRVDVLALAGTRVALGFVWEQGYRPRATPQRVRLGRFRVRALSFVGEGRVQLGINVPRGFSAVQCVPTQPELAQLGAADAMAIEG